jgi:hypothetical protein
MNEVRRELQGNSLPDTCIHEGSGKKFCLEVNKCKWCKE